jgi:hypothetical protein
MLISSIKPNFRYCCAIFARAQSKYMSLRTTIPIAVVRQFNIKEGDKLQWEFAVENGEIIVKFRKIKSS